MQGAGLTWDMFLTTALLLTLKGELIVLRARCLPGRLCAKHALVELPLNTAYK